MVKGHRREPDHRPPAPPANVLCDPPPLHRSVDDAGSQYPSFAHRRICSPKRADFVSPGELSRVGVSPWWNGSRRARTRQTRNIGSQARADLPRGCGGPGVGCVADVDITRTMGKRFTSANPTQTLTTGCPARLRRMARDHPGRTVPGKPAMTPTAIVDRVI